MVKHRKVYCAGIAGGAVALSLLGGARLAAAPDAEPLYAKARQVTASARSLKAKLRISVIEGKQSGSMTGTVEMLRPNFGRITLQGAGAMAKSGTQQFVSTGKKLFVVGVSEKKYFSVPAEPKGDNLFLMFGRILTPVVGFMDPGVIRREGAVRGVSTVTINGKPYQRVALTAQDAPTERVCYFGKSGLLEGIECSSNAASGRVVLKAWLEDLTVNPPLSARQFAYTPPAGFTLRDTSSEGKLLAIGSKAPEFSLPGAFGGKYALKDLRKGKKATLVSFWFLSCGPCRMELPHLAKQYPALKKRGLAIVAVNSDDQAKDIQQYIFEEKLNYPVALAVNERDKILNAFKVDAFPTAYLLDENGKIIWRRVGFDPEGLDAALERALK